MMYYNNKRLALSIFWLVLGLVLVVLSTAEVLNDSIYAGMGAALAVVGGLQLGRHIKYRRDPEYREKIDIEAGDERYKSSRLQSWAWTGYLFILVAAVVSVVAYFMGQVVVQQTLCYSICFMLVVYWIANVILNRKM